MGTASDGLALSTPYSHNRLTGRPHVFVGRPVVCTGPDLLNRWTKIDRGDLRSVTMSSSDLLRGIRKCSFGKRPRRLAGTDLLARQTPFNYEHTVRRPREKDGRTRLLPIRHRVAEGRSRRAPGRPRRHGPLQLAGPPGLRNGDLSCRRRRIAAAPGTTNA